MLITLEETVRKLKAGELVAIPTETVYGLAGDATNETALRSIYTLKQRPHDNPLIVHIADISQVQHWAADFPPLAETLARAFWPGALNLGVAGAISGFEHCARRSINGCLARS